MAGKNRIVRFKKPSAIITDIEGTTTSLRYWNEILTPFIKDHLELCLHDTWSNPETIDAIGYLRNKTYDDIANGDLDIPPIVDDNGSRNEIINSVIKNVHYLMHKRKQSNELKSIQLLVWLYGYQNDLLKGHVFSDVHRSFQHWKNDLGLRLFTFTTGDALVQKMLYANTLYGNLIPYIEEFFNYDTIGKKTDTDSYRIISEAIQVPTNKVIFLSHNIQELNASASVGVIPCLVIRPHNKYLLDATTPFKTIQSFEELEFF